MNSALSLVRPFLQSLESNTPPSPEQVAPLTALERGWIRQQWNEAQIITLRHAYDVVRESGSIPIARAMPEWVNPYLRRVVALYPERHLMRRILLGQATIEDIRIASKSIKEAFIHSIATSTLEVTQIAVEDLAGYYLVYSDGLGIHRTLHLVGTPLYATPVDSLDLWAIVKRFPRPYYAVSVSEAEGISSAAFSVEITARTLTERH